VKHEAEQDIARRGNQQISHAFRRSQGYCRQGHKNN